MAFSWQLRPWYPGKSCRPPLAASSSAAAILSNRSVGLRCPCTHEVHLHILPFFFPLKKRPSPFIKGFVAGLLHIFSDSLSANPFYGGVLIARDSSKFLCMVATVAWNAQMCCSVNDEQVLSACNTKWLQRSSPYSISVQHVIIPLSKTLKKKEKKRREKESARQKYETGFHDPAVHTLLRIMDGHDCWTLLFKGYDSAGAIPLVSIRFCSNLNKWWWFCHHHSED